MSKMSSWDMKPLTINVEGKYVDSYLYSGVLYLFNNDATVSKVDWRRLIREKFCDPESSVAIRCAFSNSDYLYGDKFSFVFQDEEIKKVVQDRFRNLPKTRIDLSLSEIAGYIYSKIDYSEIFPHADFSISGGRIFASSLDGVWRGKQSGKQEELFEDSEKIWDCPANTVSPSGGRLAVAAGEEGLFEAPIDGEIPVFEKHNLSKKHSSSCSRSYESIYSSSPIGGGYLASFDSKKIIDIFTKKPTTLRTFDRPIDSESIFGGASGYYTWGAQNRIYSYGKDRTLRVARYAPWLSGQERFQTIKEVSIQAWKGEIVSASAALFGTVVQFDNAIVLLRSDDGDPITMSDDFVNWRVFPRSRSYENHLHIVRPKYLEICSFNHDYFVPQGSKIFGFSRQVDRRFSGVNFNKSH